MNNSTDLFFGRQVTKELWELIFRQGLQFPQKIPNREQLYQDNVQLIKDNYDLWLVFYSGRSFLEVSELIKERFNREIKFNFNFSASLDEEVTIKESILESRDEPGYYLIDMSGKSAMLYPEEQEKLLPELFQRASLSLALEAMETVNYINDRHEHKQKQHLHVIPFGEYIIGLGLIKKNVIHLEVWEKENYQPKMSKVVLAAKRIK